MDQISLIKNSFSGFLRSRNQRTIAIFCKSLYGFLILKILFLLSTIHDIVRYAPPQINGTIVKVVFAPALLAQHSPGAFLIAAEVVLVVAIIVRVNVYLAGIIFWISFSISRLAFPIMIGSDQVLNLFLLFGVLMPAGRRGSETGNIIANAALLMARIQWLLIYLLSGVDKLKSPAWRSGDAIYSISNLEFFWHPLVAGTWPHWLDWMAAWAIIIFELAFPFLICFRKSRSTAIALGVLFHLSIIFFLNLPDFGVVMILGFTLFLNFRDKQKPNV